MLKAEMLTGQQLQQLAFDQTPIYKSAMLGFLHPLSDKLQVGADATIVNLSQPISPIALDPSLATLAAGNEYYLSTQFIGNNIVKDGDMYIAALRYSHQTTEDQYVLDFNTRYPLTKDLLLSPRLRLGYTIGNAIGLEQYIVLPSLLVDYHLTSDLTFEFEIGTQWTRAVQAGIKTNDSELFATIGLRYSFGSDFGASTSDQRSKLTTPAAAALCRYSARPDGSNCASPSVGGQ
jgi:hypothetical protein